MKKENRGGSRIGSGRKSLYGELTALMQFKVPKSKEKHIKKVVKRYLKKYEKTT